MEFCHPNQAEVFIFQNRRMPLVKNVLVAFDCVQVVAVRMTDGVRVRGKQVHHNYPRQPCSYCIESSSYISQKHSPETKVFMDVSDGIC